MRQIGLRARLAAALVGVAVLAVGLATILGNRGLEPRSRRRRRLGLERSAEHFAEVAATVRAGHRKLVRCSADADTPRRVGRPPRRSPRWGAARAPERRPERRTGERPGLGQWATDRNGDGLARGRRPLHTRGGAFARIARPPAPDRGRHRNRRCAPGRIPARTDTDRPTGSRRPRSAWNRVKSTPARPRCWSWSRLEGLNRLSETLEQEEEVRKANVADLAHELRTPVNALLARIEAAQDGVLVGPDNLAAMHTEALRLTRSWTISRVLPMRNGPASCSTRARSTWRQPLASPPTRSPRASPNRESTSASSSNRSTLPGSRHARADRDQPAQQCLPLHRSG